MRLIDADALLENYNLKDATKYGNKNAEQQYKSYSTMMMYEIADMIEDAPTINEWIPCSERLPEDIEGNLIECYLVTDGFLQWMAYYNSEIGWQFAECTNSRNKIDWTEVIAWQPLPQPYKGE